MSERRTIGRVKLPLHRGAADSVAAPVEVTPSEPETGRTPPDGVPGAHAASAEAEAPVPADKALQVLTLAQRTAESHITDASRHAREVRAEAEALAERIRRDADSYADHVRAEVDGLMAQAAEAAELRVRDADARAAEIRGQAESALADAHVEAERIVVGSRDRAEELDHRARQRYEDAVGSLSIKREALQKQIETLAVFDADYRHRLASFMQNQLRSLWVESPGARGGPDTEAPLPGGPVGAFERI